MKNASSFEILYNTYSSMLYAIALEISPDPKEAEEILIHSFQRAYKQNIFQQNSPSVCVALIKLIVQTAQERLNPDQKTSNFKLKQFENAPLLHKILCEPNSLDQYSEETKFTRNELSKKLRNEMLILRKLRNINSHPVNGLTLTTSL